MSEFTLDTNNIADVAHPWYRGTIAIDTAGKYMEEFISRLLPEGYSFAGMEIYLGNIYTVESIAEHPVNIIIRDGNGQYKKIQRTIQLKRLLESFINLEVKFSFASDFTDNNIQWNEIEELED